MADAMIETKAEFNGQTFKDITYKATTLELKVFYDCTFANCVFQEVRFVACRFYDCTFKKCDLSLSTVRDCIFSETMFEDSKLTGINWAEMSQETLIQKPVNFKDCTLNYGTFIGLNLKGIRIISCMAHDVDFADADLTQADFSNTDLAESHFRHTNLTKADFTKAHNYAIDPGINTLTKAKFSLPEALSLLRNMDIFLKE